MSGKSLQELKDAKKQEFLNAFEDYFRERGFVIRKRTDSVQSSFDTLHFKAFANEAGELFITRGKEQIAEISICSNRETNPEFFYTAANSNIHFDSPLSVLESIFESE